MRHKVALVGAGTMGTVHAAAYAAMENVDFVGVVSEPPEASAKLANRYHTRAFSDCEAMLAVTRPEIVDVCLPTYLHAEYVSTFAKKGVHVICEKPLARDLAEAAAMIDASRRSGTRLFVAHVARFSPAYETAHRMIRAGDIGTPGTAYAMRGGTFPKGWNNWYADSERSGTLILDLMIHDFDFLRWCLGDVERVYAKSLGKTALDQVDHAFVSLRFADGTIASVEGTWAYPTGFRTAFEFSGRGGTITHDSETETPVKTYLRSSQYSASDVPVSETPLVKSPYQLELEHFIECLESGEEPVVTAEDAYRALEIGLAAVESVSTGLPVDLNTSAAAPQ